MGRRIDLHPAQHHEQSHVRLRPVGTLSRKNERIAVKRFRGIENVRTPIGEGDAVLAISLHACLRNNPNRVIRINLIPPSIQDFTRPGRSQNQKLEREPGRQAAIGGAHGVDERWYFVIGQRRVSLFPTNMPRS